MGHWIWDVDLWGRLCAHERTFSDHLSDLKPYPNDFCKWFFCKKNVKSKFFVGVPVGDSSESQRTFYLKMEEDPLISYRVYSQLKLRVASLMEKIKELEQKIITESLKSHRLGRRVREGLMWLLVKNGLWVSKVKCYFSRKHWHYGSKWKLLTFQMDNVLRSLPFSLGPTTTSPSHQSCACVLKSTSKDARRSPIADRTSRPDFLGDAAR